MQTDSLNKSIDEIKIDEKFKIQAKKLGINFLKDVINLNLAELKADPNFTYIWYTDLLQILKSEGLLDFFQEKLYKK